MNITFNDLRRIKDNLPHGSMQKIADELGINVQTVRNFFGGTHYKEGKPTGINIEQGPDGGIVHIEDTQILELANKMLHQEQVQMN